MLFRRSFKKATLQVTRFSASLCQSQQRSYLTGKGLLAYHTPPPTLWIILQVLRKTTNPGTLGITGNRHHLKATTFLQLSSCSTKTTIDARASARPRLTHFLIAQLEQILLEAPVSLSIQYPSAIQRVISPNRQSGDCLCITAFLAIGVAKRLRLGALSS